MLALALVISSASVATAQPRDEAGRRYAQAVSAFAASDFAAALSGFQETFVLTRRSEILINVAVCFQRLGRTHEAIASYRNYLALSGPSANRAAIERTVAQLERDLAATRSPTAPSTPPVETPPVVAPPVVTPAPSAPVWPWVAIGTGAALALGGGLMFALQSDPGADPSINDEAAYLSARDQRSTLQTVGAVIGGVGVVAATVGVIGAVTRGPSRPQRTSFDLRWRPLDGGGALLLSRPF